MVSSVLAALASRLLVSLAAGAAACAAAGAAAAPALPAACRAPLVAGSPAVGPAAQVITVAASPADRTRASVRLWERRGRCWAAVAGAWPARLGYNGLSVRHREGDGTTPSGTFGIGPVMYGTGPDPGVRFRYHRLVCGDWWDEDPVSPTYNTFRHVACGTTPAFSGRQRGALAGNRRLLDARGRPLQRRSGRPRRRLGDLPPRRQRPRDDRLRQPAAGATCSCCSAGCGRPRGRSS